MVRPHALLLSLFISAVAIAQQPVSVQGRVQPAAQPDAKVHVKSVEYAGHGTVRLQLENTSDAAVSGVYVEYHLFVPAACTEAGRDLRITSHPGPGVGRATDDTKDAKPHVPYTSLEIPPHGIAWLPQKYQASMLMMNAMSRQTRYMRAAAMVRFVKLGNENELPEQKADLSGLNRSDDAATCQQWTWNAAMPPVRSMEDKASDTAHPVSADASGGVTFSCSVTDGNLVCP